MPAVEEPKVAVINRGCSAVHLLYGILLTSGRERKAGKTIKSVGNYLERGSRLEPQGFALNGSGTPYCPCSAGQPGLSLQKWDRRSFPHLRCSLSLLWAFFQ